MFSKHGGNWWGTPFFEDMLEGSEEVEKEFYRVWRDFVQDDFQELLDYVQDYYDFAAASIKRNKSRWPNEGTDYAASVSQACQWLTERCEYIMSTIKTFEVGPESDSPKGDVNGDGRLSLADIVALVGYLMTGESDELIPELSDLDNDNAITESDLRMDVNLVTGTGKPKPYIRASQAQAILEMDAFEAGLGEVTTATVRLIPDRDSDNDPYTACDLLLTLPQGMALIGTKAFSEDGMDDLQVVSTELENRQTRLTIWSPALKAIQTGDWLQLSLLTTEVVPEELRILSLGSASLFSEHGEEYRLSSVSTGFKLTNGITTTTIPFSVRGGRLLTIDAVEPTHVEIFTPAGLLVASVDVDAGCSQMQLPDGIYIVSGKKVIVNGQ